jgi:hypothetical protein
MTVAFLGAVGGIMSAPFGEFDRCSEAGVAKIGQPGKA